jgi:hypothetical protein
LLYCFNEWQSSHSISKKKLMNLSKYHLSQQNRRSNEDPIEHDMKTKIKCKRTWKLEGSRPVYFCFSAEKSKLAFEILKSKFLENELKAEILKSSTKSVF